ncbi:MAG: transporter [Propionibacteriaceae bacterium]|nr:transporter [Propionibacteriaceae bacterium]
MFRSLSVPNYRKYFWGGMISNTGVWMQRTAQAWVVLQLSGASGTSLGLVTLAQFGPAMVFSVYAGTLSDRYSKIKLLVLTQTLLGLTSLILAILDVTNVVTLNHVYALALAVGVITAFDMPARQAFASELVGPNNIANAIGLNTASFNTARLLGPPLAGLMIGGLNTWSIFFVHAASSIAIVVTLLRIDVSELSRQAALARAPGQLLAGFRFVRHAPTLIIFIGLASLVAAVGANSLQVVIPLIATERFGSDALGFGMLSAALAVGGLLGALLASMTSGMPRQRWVFGAAVLLGVSQLVASLMPSLVTFAIALVLVGLLFMSFVVLANTSVQLAAPAAVRGRVIAVYMMFFMGGGALGAPALGALADWLSPMQTVTVAGAFSIAVGAGCATLALFIRRRLARQAPAPVWVPEEVTTC